MNVNQAAVHEMHRQVGDLVINAEGLAQRGLLVRHLVLPNDISGVETVLKFLAEEVSANTYLNLMGQYRPCYRAGEHPALDRPSKRAEFSEALALARRYGLRRLDPDSFRYEPHSISCKRNPRVSLRTALAQIYAELSATTTFPPAKPEFGQAGRRDWRVSPPTARIRAGA